MNSNNTKKYDDDYIDNLLKRALKSDETPDTELTRKVGAISNRPQKR